jgi:hypothetical protein
MIQKVLEDNVMYSGKGGSRPNHGSANQYCPSINLAYTFMATP